MEQDLEKHHQKIDSLIIERKQQHAFFKRHIRLITATTACFTVAILIFGIFYSFMFLPIATQKVNQRLNLKSTPFISPQPTQIQNQNINTTNWKTYTDKKAGFELKYPPDYSFKEEKNSVRFSGTYFGSLTISKDNLVDYKNGNDCNSLDPLGSESENYPCIYKDSIKYIVLDDKKAVGFYGDMVPVHGSFHAVQTIEFPHIQLLMNISGGGLDQEFSDILSTFKLTQ